MLVDAAFLALDRPEGITPVEIAEQITSTDPTYVKKVLLPLLLCLLLPLLLLLLILLRPRYCYPIPPTITLLLTG